MLMDEIDLFHGSHSRRVGWCLWFSYLLLLLCIGAITCVATIEKRGTNKNGEKQHNDVNAGKE